MYQGESLLFLRHKIPDHDNSCRYDRKTHWIERSLTEKPCILIVDDNADVRKALSAYLSILSWLKGICVASNGEEALESEPPDMILMDIKMPVISGLETTRLIKKHWPAIKIINLTPYPDYQT
jgi:CheY-like chemotaxis protein